MADSFRYKIVIFGAFGAGKTTLIRTLDPRSRQVESACAGGKPTVALDFGRVQIGGRLVYFFGTPGQERFEFAREIIARGMDGAVLLLDASVPIDEFSRHLFESLVSSKIPFTIFLNKFERTPSFADEIRIAFAPVSACQISALERMGALDALTGFVASIPRKDL